MAAKNIIFQYKGTEVQVNAYIFEPAIKFHNGGQKRANVSFKYGDIWFNHLQVVDNKLKQPLSYQSIRAQGAQTYTSTLVECNIIPKDLKDEILEVLELKEMPTPIKDITFEKPTEYGEVSEADKKEEATPWWDLNL